MDQKPTVPAILAEMFTTTIKFVAEKANVSEDDVRIEFSASSPNWAVRVQVKARRNSRADQAMGYSESSIEEAAVIAIHSVEAFRRIHAEDKARAKRKG